MSEALRTGGSRRPVGWARLWGQGSVKELSIEIYI